MSLKNDENDGRKSSLSTLPGGSVHVGQYILVINPGDYHLSLWLDGDGGLGFRHCGRLGAFFDLQTQTDAQPFSFNSTLFRRDADGGGKENTWMELSAPVSSRWSQPGHDYCVTTSSSKLSRPLWIASEQMQSKERPVEGAVGHAKKAPVAWRCAEAPPGERGHAHAFFSCGRVGPRVSRAQRRAWGTALQGLQPESQSGGKLGPGCSRISITVFSCSVNHQ